MIWIIWMGEGDDHLLPIMQTEKPLVGKIALVNFILQMIWMDRTVPKRTAPCCNHFCPLYWSSRHKSLLLAGLSRATMFSKWSGLTERVGLLPVSLVWYDNIFFVYFLDHSGEKASCWVTTGLRIGAVYVYIGACLGILAAVALLSTLTQLYTEEKITTWMGQACESARFCPDRIYFSWSSVLMASSSQLVSPQSLQRKSPKTEFKTIQTQSMGTAERSSDNVYFKEFRVGLYHRKMFSQNKCLFYFSLIISDLFQAE